MAGAEQQPTEQRDAGQPHHGDPVRDGDDAVEARILVVVDCRVSDRTPPGLLAYGIHRSESTSRVARPWTVCPDTAPDSHVAGGDRSERRPPRQRRRSAGTARCPNPYAGQAMGT